LYHRIKGVISQIGIKIQLKKKESSLWSLNATQFFGVVNDNLYKLLMIFLLIDTLGKEKASSILSAAGAIYVIPFLLFSSSAGILADRFSKQKLMVWLKSIEVVIMLLAIPAFYFKSSTGCYLLLFVLATHSAMFGPSKYGIIPEVVPEDKVSKANGLITSFTYVAIIFGTFLATFLTEISGKKFVITALFCLLTAILGLISSLFVEKTKSQGSTKKMNLLFITEIVETLRFCRGTAHLVPAMLGSAFFLFIGAFTQLNIIPFAMQALNLSEVAGGYLFLIVALGIAAGSILSGKWSKKRIELGLTTFAGAGLAFFLILISFFSFSLPATALLLVLLGFAGGVFIVPFDTFIQMASPIEKRGQVIAAANFLSFLGVLLASFSLYLFNDVLSMSSSLSFAVMGIITAIACLLLTLRLSSVVIPYVARKLIFRAKYIKLEEPMQWNDNPTLYILEEATTAKAILLSTLIPEAIFITSIKEKRPLWQRLIFPLEQAKDCASDMDLIAWAKNKLASQSCCLLLQGKLIGQEGKQAPEGAATHPHQECITNIKKIRNNQYNVIIKKFTHNK
jgi:acyl-[acyl-carrier-protein]-phospholipid O-acyltransferase/long-chain-fatty-acid--[acyl-carrier-protein] ligase